MRQPTPKSSRLRRFAVICGALPLLLLVRAGLAMEFAAFVPLEDKGLTTFYVEGQIEGIGPVEFMIDTGSGYTTINQATLRKLQREERVHYVKQLSGILADGSRMRVPVYRISSITIGDTCQIHDVEAAVFPGQTRFILGLSALMKTAPFAFAIDPPRLALGNCISPQRASVDQPSETPVATPVASLESEPRSSGSGAQ